MWSIVLWTQEKCLLCAQVECLLCAQGVSIVHTGLDRTGECLLCVQGSVSYVYRGSVSCVYRVQGECLMCTQGECFLFVCLIKGIYCWYNILHIVHLLVIKKKAVSTVILPVWHKCMPQVWQCHNVSFLHSF